MPNFRAFCRFDVGRVFAFEAEWQAIESCSSIRSAIQSLNQVRRQGNLSWFAVKLNVDVDGISFGDARGGPIRGTYAYQALASHQCHSATPRMAVDGDRDRRAGFGPEVLHDFCGNFDTGGVPRRNYESSKLQFMDPGM